MSPTQFQREKINDALVKCNGDKKLAAELLEMSVQTLYSKIRRCSILSARWRRNPYGVTGDLPLPQPTDMINRDLVNYQQNYGQNAKIGDVPALPTLDAPLSAQDVALDKAMAAEDQKVRSGLAKMGMSPEELEIAIGCQRFGESFFRESLQLIGGGATRTAILIQKQIGKIDKRLEDVRAMLPVVGTANDAAALEARKSWVDEESYLIKALAMMSCEARKMMEMGFKSALIRATIEKNGVERMKKAKPGFVPV